MCVCVPVYVCVCLSGCLCLSLAPRSCPAALAPPPPPRALRRGPSERALAGARPPARGALACGAQGGGRAGAETRQAGRALPSPPGLRRLHGQTQAARDVRAKHKRNLSQHSWLTAVAKASPTRSIPLLALHWAVGVCSHTHTHTHTHTRGVTMDHSFTRSADSLTHAH